MSYLFRKASALICITGLLVTFSSGVNAATASCTYNLGFDAHGFTHSVNNRHFVVQEKADYSWYNFATKKTIRQRAKRQMTASTQDCAAHWMSHVVKNAAFNISPALDTGARLRCGAVHDSSLSYLIWTYPTAITYDSLALDDPNEPRSFAEQDARQSLVNDMKRTLSDMCNESSTENVNVNFVFSNVSNDGECHNIAPVSFTLRCYTSIPIGVSQNILDLYNN